MLNDTQVGSVTSGGWGHRVGKNIVLAHVAAGTPRAGLTIGILGEEFALTDQVGAFYDPDFSLVRGK